jgi:putative transcriptional regulator
MGTIRKTIEVQSAQAKPVGRVDVGLLDATGEAEIDRQRSEDDADALRDATRFARRVRLRLGFRQAQIAERISVSLNTIRNWEQGERHPSGAAKALLRVLDKAPEAALAALG